MKTIAIYPGSFNPFHIGHLNIVEKTERIFGKGNVVIAMGINPDKMDVHKSEQFHLKNEQSKELSHKIGREVIVYTDFLHQVVTSNLTSSCCICYTESISSHHLISSEMR